VAVLQLLGFSSWELADKADSAEPFSPPMMKYANAREPLGLNDLYEQIWRGDFPAIATNHQMDRDLFYGSYVQTYLQRDVKALVLTPSPYPPRGKTASFKWLFASAPQSEKPYLLLDQSSQGPNLLSQLRCREGNLDLVAKRMAMLRLPTSSRPSLRQRNGAVSFGFSGLVPRYRGGSPFR